MSKTIHIEGKAHSIDIPKELSDNYDLDANFDFENESLEVIPDCFIRIWVSEKECTLEEAQESELRKVLGDMTLVGQEVGYSEYTITGFEVHSAFIGGHSVQAILDEVPYGHYVHILIEQNYKHTETEK